jgi:alginate O-acetyltransferase complex protein AlgJ
VRAAGAQRPVAANRALLAAMHGFETRLEEESWLVEELLPPVQLLLTAGLGVGNEQVYLGRPGWLFYRPAVDALVAPPLLDPSVLRARRRGGESWEPAVEPDPRPALRELHALLARRGIRLLVVPAPGKASVHPERLSPRPLMPPLHDPAFAALGRELAGAGIGWLDLAPPLATAARESGRPQYLRTDSHWTPGGMDVAARSIADWVERHAGLDGPKRAYRRAPGLVEGVGDLARMLELPAASGLYPPQRTTVLAVRGPDGTPWSADPGAELLLLGDSFTNVYSAPDLGWGGGAGLAEQLAFHLQRPVDRIAINAGGAHASRQALARELAAGRDRLRGKRVVIYQLAARELAWGDWQRMGWEPE